MRRYVEAAPTLRIMLVNGDCHTFTPLADWFGATSAGPGVGRVGEQCDMMVPLMPDSIMSYTELANLDGGSFKCCARPGEATGPEGMDQSSNAAMNQRLFSLPSIAQWAAPVFEVVVQQAPQSGALGRVS